MTSQSIGVNVLAAPLAAIDRRALSQAWYSALHLARNAPHRPASAPLPSFPRAGNARAATRGRAIANHSFPLAARAVAPIRSRGEVADVWSERRAARSVLARRIERTFVNPKKPVTRATFDLGDRGRVVVSLQRNGERLVLIALCSAPARPLVAEALAQARFALARRGLAVQLLRERIVCS